MKTNIEDYIKVYDNYLSKELCDEILKEYKKITWARVSSDEFSVEGTSFDTSFDLIDSEAIVMDQFHMLISKYLEFLDLSYFQGWNGYTNIKHDKFKEGDAMAKHCDHIHTLFSDEHEGVPILTIHAVINTDYEGGDLIFYDDKKIKVKQGDVLVFPSSFLHPYRIEPITKGVKHTIVSWVW